jgi:hypothetical protein
MPTEFINRFEEAVSPPNLEAPDVNFGSFNASSPSLTADIQRVDGYWNERSRVLEHIADEETSGHTRARIRRNLLTDARSARQASRSVALETLPKLRALDAMGVFDNSMEAGKAAIEEVGEVNVFEELLAIFDDDELREQLDPETEHLLERARTAVSELDTEITLSGAGGEFEATIGDDSFPIRFATPDTVVSDQGSVVTGRPHFAGMVREVENVISTTGGAPLVTSEQLTSVAEDPDDGRPVVVCPRCGFLALVVESVRMHEMEVRELEDVGIPLEEGAVIGYIADVLSMSARFVYNLFVDLAEYIEEEWKKLIMSVMFLIGVVRCVKGDVQSCFSVAGMVLMWFGFEEIASYFSLEGSF